MKHFIVFIFMLLFFIPASQAQIRIEPYYTGPLGLGISDSEDFKYLNIFSFQTSLFSTSSVGIRIGSEFLITHTGVDIFMNPSYTKQTETVFLSAPKNTKIGLDQSNNSIEVHSNPSSHVNKDFNPIFLGIYTSIDLLLLSNVFGTIFGTFNIVDWKILHKGFGVKVGCTLLTLFRVQFNIEAQVAKYFCSDEKCKDFTTLSGVASISFPFRIDPF